MFSSPSFEQPTQEKKQSLDDKCHAMMVMMKGLETNIETRFETMGKNLDARVDKLKGTYGA